MAFDVEDPKRFEKYALEDLKVPHEGDTVYLDRYWVVTPDEHVLFARGCSAQCNPNIAVMEHIMPNYPTCRMERVAVAYVPHKFTD